MKTFTQYLEALAHLAHVNYADQRYKRSPDEVIQAVKNALSGYVDPTRHEILGHGLRSQEDVRRVFDLGLQAPNQIFHRLVMTVFEAGLPLNQQPVEAFESLLQWPFGRRQHIILVAAPPNDPDSVWRPIGDDEEKSFLPTALGGVKFTIDPQHIIGCFDASQIKFLPNV